MRRSTRLTMMTVILVAWSGAALAQSRQGGPGCDRVCLIRTVDRYLAALVAHEPARLELAANAKLVENTIPTKPGDGLWKTASAAPATFKIYVPDPVSEEVGFLGVMQERTEEGEKPILLALRLKLEAGRLAEMEHLIARNLRESSLPNLQTPRPGLLATIPASAREPRDELLRIGASYYDALDQNNGSLAPFADDCVRRENGMQTTSNPPPKETGGLATFGAMGCAEQLDTNVMSYIDTIGNRRVEIADPETGLVFGLSHFHHSMKNRSIKIVGVPGIETNDMSNTKPFDLPAAHIYKVRGGTIHEIEAMGFVMPYGSKSGWE